MAYGTLASDAIQSSTTGSPPQFNDGSGTQIGTLCRAWVKFAGSAGGATIGASFNVTSVTRTGTGNYTIAFTNALTDANYALQTSIGAAANGNTWSFYESSGVTRTSSQVGVVFNASGTAFDPSVVSISVFR